MKTKSIIIIVFIALFLIVLLQNTQVVELTLFFKTISMSLFILLIPTLLLGFVAGFIVARITKKSVIKE